MKSLWHVDLSGLESHLIFKSKSPFEIQTKLSASLNEHNLTLGAGKKFSSLYERKLNEISIIKLTYGAEAEIMARPFTDFSLAQTPINGSFEIEINGHKKLFNPGDVAILSPRKDLKIRWQEGSEQLILKIPNYLTSREASSLCIDPDTNPYSEFTRPAFRLDDGLSLIWHSIVQQAIDLPNSPALSNIWLDHFERNIALFLISHQSSNQQHILLPKHPTPPAIKKNGINPIARMEDYIRKKLCAPVSLADLANAARVSPRSLNALCHRYRGVTPMILLRNMRLDAVREKLKTGPKVNITALALDHGFGHLGRFSAYYRDRFGEYPKNTSE